MIPLVLLGAGGTALEVIDLVAALNRVERRYEIVALLDDAPALQGTARCGVSVAGPLARTREFAGARVVDTLGSPHSFRARQTLVEGLGIPPERFVTLVHPDARVSDFAAIGTGSLVFAFGVVAAGARIGQHAILLPHSVVHHGASVGDWSILASQVVLAGDAAIGESCYLGAGSRVIQRARVGARALIGMGSVVLHDVAADATVAGVPARVLPHRSAE